MSTINTNIGQGSGAYDGISVSFFTQVQQGSNKLSGKLVESIDDLPPVVGDVVQVFTPEQRSYVIADFPVNMPEGIRLDLSGQGRLSTAGPNSILVGNVDVDSFLFSTSGGDLGLYDLTIQNDGSGDVLDLDRTGSGLLTLDNINIFNSQSAGEIRNTQTLRIDDFILRLMAVSGLRIRGTHGTIHIEGITLERASYIALELAGR